MKNAPQTPAIGLDVGTSRIVTAARSNEDFHYKSQLNAFVTVPWSKMTESSLKREGVPFVVHSDTGEKSIIVPGNESSRFADLLQTETRRPMTRDRPIIPAFAAVASNQIVVSHARPAAVRDSSHNLVADMVPIGIIHLFKIIDIQPDQR